MKNPYTLVYYGCNCCEDLGMVIKRGRPQRCPYCLASEEASDEEKLENWLKRKRNREEAYWRRLGKPSITMDDLSDEEFEILKTWMYDTGLPKERLLLWIEGRRWRPDPKFRAEVDRHLHPDRYEVPF